MDDTYNPDWRYANMTQTEIEDHVKSRSTILLTRQHVIPESSGKKIKFRVTEKDLEHLVADALHRSKGVLLISDIADLPRHFNSAKYIQSANDNKKKKKGVKYQYYEISIAGRRMYLNIKVDRIKKEIRLHSITSTIQTTAAKR
ncbi:MAG: hypothetical protein IKX35_09350 [Bacteroidales bacterium]|nr:hypothetical protein [Bacteroidales bacterium]MBR5082629.1 hypothetical protein [Bacteroidales bacterium]